MSKSKLKNRLLRFIKRLFVWLFLLILGLNIFIWISGRTYLYKGLKETYLSGRSGPGIYDSLTFPTRTIPAAKDPFTWDVHPKGKETLTAEEKAALDSIQTSSFLIIQDGRIRLENYFNDHHVYTRSNSFSAAKSFIGLSIGIAIDKGFIDSFDDTITKYLPFEIKGAENVTIKHLMAMSSDINWSESGSNPFSDNAWAYYGSDLKEVCKSVSFGDQPGKTFDYASGNSQLLGYILMSASGLHPTEFIQKYVWSKIGTKKPLSWSLDREGGMEKAFCCIYATTRDYARFGQLLLNNGVWEGSTIVDSTTLQVLNTPLINETPQYGLHFWRLQDPDHPAIYARGILGQYIISIPSLNMVVVRTGHERKDKFPEEKNNYKSLHPKDLFTYISIAKRIANRDK